MEQILAPLNMTHSFFGRIPDSLLPDIGIPGAPNFADLTMGLGYDPVGGLWVRQPCLEGLTLTEFYRAYSTIRALPMT